MHDLTGRGIGRLKISCQGANLDTTTANGRLLFGVSAALAEFERELIIERMHAGGRPPARGAATVDILSR